MARRPSSRPSRTQAAAAREAARRDALPIRFVADYSHVTPAVTTAYKAGMVLMPPPEHRRDALAKGKAVVDGDSGLLNVPDFKKLLDGKVERVEFTHSGRVVDGD